MSLFQLGDFTLASGVSSPFRIECDALTTADWDALAWLAVQRLPAFRFVEGVPRGGVPFAKALEQYTRSRSDLLLIAEDVVTTGQSMERFRDERDAIGVCVFARGLVPEWVTPLFVMTG